MKLISFKEVLAHLKIKGDKVEYKKLNIKYKKEQAKEDEKEKKDSKYNGKTVQDADKRFYTNKRRILIKIFENIGISLEFFKKSHKDYCFPATSMKFILDILKEKNSSILTKPIQKIIKKEDIYQFFVKGLINMFDDIDQFVESDFFGNIDEVEKIEKCREIKGLFLMAFINLKAEKYYLKSKMKDYRKQLISILELKPSKSNVLVEATVPMNYNLLESDGNASCKNAEKKSELMSFIDKVAILDYSLSLFDNVIEIIKVLYNKCRNYRENDNSQKIIEKFISKRIDEDKPPTEDQIIAKLLNSEKLVNKAIENLNKSQMQIIKNYTPKLLKELEYEKLEKILLYKKSNKIIFEEGLCYREPKLRKKYKTR